MDARELMESSDWVEPAAQALALPLTHGADFSELFFEDKLETRISSNGHQITASSSTHMHGAGLYLMSGTQTRYGFTNNTDAHGLSALAANLGSLAPWKAAAAPSAVLPVQERTYAPHNTVLKSPETVDAKVKAHLLNQVCAEARAYSPKIVEVHADYQDRIQNVAVLNSEGLLARERRVITTLRLFVTAADGDRMNGAWNNFSSGHGFEFLEDDEERSRMVSSTCENAMNGLVARGVSPQVMPVVVDSGTFIHEDCGHPLESTHLAGGTGVYYGKIGEQVASPLVTIGDSGEWPELCGSFAMSDEGVEAKDNVLIENGVLKGYMVDRLGSRQLGMPQTSAGRRQDYRFAPVARMSNTYLKKGTTPTDSIIPSVSHGLYVREVGGGNVNPTTGNFNFLAVSGNIIENGELTYPISNINLSGQSIGALKRIAAVGDSYFPDYGSLCGADSGLVYVTAFMPRVLIDGMMVG